MGTEDLARLAILTAVCVLALCLYLAPALVAGARKHHQGVAIFVLNLLLGWTVLGWIAALVWACTAVSPPSETRAPS